MFKGISGNNEIVYVRCGREDNYLYVVIIIMGLGIYLNDLIIEKMRDLFFKLLKLKKKVKRMNMYKFKQMVQKKGQDIVLGLGKGDFFRDKGWKEINSNDYEKELWNLNGMSLQLIKFFFFLCFLLVVFCVEKIDVGFIKRWELVEIIVVGDVNIQYVKGKLEESVCI